MKKLLAILMALALCLSSMLVMVSCGDDDGNESGGEQNGDNVAGEGGNNSEGEGGNTDNNDGSNGGEAESKVEYKVTVKNQNGEAVAGVKVMVLDSANKPVVSAAVATDAQGEVKFSLAEGTYTAMISGGQGYTVNPLDMMKAFGQDKSASFTVQTEEAKEYLTYTVKVVDQNGAPVAGVVLQACTESCIPFSNPTDANGETSQDLEVVEGEYKVQLNIIPDGYSEIDDDNDPSTPVKYSFDENRLAVVTITKN